MATMKRLICGMLFLLPIWSGCAEEQVDFFECPLCLEDLAGVPVEPDIAPDLPVGSLPVGFACAASDECVTGACFCGDTVSAECLDLKTEMEGKGGEWPFVFSGGLCSTAGCDPTKADACGEGSTCLDLGPALGSEEVVAICSNFCEAYSDCRYQEGYVCYYTGVDKQRACLPGQLVAAMPCGNGKCDANESADTCPRDCQ